MNESLVTIIVLSWNTSEDTIECLLSLEKLDDRNHRVVLVDNGSTDGTLERVRSRFPDVHIIENRGNLGYALGNNVGLTYALNTSTDFILVLNSDVVVDPSLLVNLREAFRLLDVPGLLGVKVLSYSKREVVHSCGGYWSSCEGRVVKLNLENTHDYDGYQTPFEVDFVHGCAFFTSADTFRRVGLLDQAFFAYWEDTDLSYRTQLAGLKNYCVPSARVWHKVSMSTEGGSHPIRYYFMVRNRILLQKKHEGERLFRNSPTWISKEVVRLVNSNYWLKWTALAATIVGALQGMLGRGGTAPNWLWKNKADFLEFRIRLLETRFRNALRRPT